MKALLIGNSHIQQIERAYEHFGHKDNLDFRFLMLNATKYAPWVERSSGKFVLSQTVRDDIEHELSAFDPDVIFLSLGGNEHFIQVAANDPRPFDFYLPDRPDLAVMQGYEIVGYQLIKAMLEYGIRDLYDSISFICNGVRKIYCVALPPVPEDDEFFLSKIGVDMKAAAEQRGIPYPGARFKMWRLSSDILAAWAHDHGALILPVPPTSLNEAGFIREDLRGDAFHGGLEFANLVIKQMMVVQNEW